MRRIARQFPWLYSGIRGLVLKAPRAFYNLHRCMTRTFVVSTTSESRVDEDERRVQFVEEVAA